MIDYSNLGIQLWSLRDELELSPQETLERLRIQGFNLVETTELPQLVRLFPLLEEYGLRAKSSFMQWSYISGRWDLTDDSDYPDKRIESQFELAKKLGLSYVVNGYFLPSERRTFSDFQCLTETMQIAAEKAADFDLKFAYHNHGFEFGLADSKGQSAMEYLIANTDDLVFELDIMWAYMAKQNIPDLISKMAQRLKLLHIKDTKNQQRPLYDDQVKPKSDFVAAGSGKVPILDILNCLTGIDYFYIEQDYSRDIFSDIEKSKQFLLSSVQTNFIK